MHRLAIPLGVALATLSLGAVADTPQQMVAAYAAAAAATQPGFTPSADRGRALYQRRFAVTASMASCSACHTDDPTAAGKHAVTGKAIQPLAPAANPERLTSATKVEKWFRRNCNDVVGRECSAPEKADILQFLIQRG
jgi:mono/diheme cytochrome c family protein